MPLPPLPDHPFFVDKKTDEAAHTAAQTARLAEQFKDMPRPDVAEHVYQAARADDINTLNAIAVYHPDCARYRQGMAKSPDAKASHAPVIFGAICEGNLRAMQWLIDHGADLEDRCGWDYTTALYCAVRLQRTELVAALLAADANPYAVTGTNIDMRSAAQQTLNSDICAMIDAAQAKGYVMRVRPLSFVRKPR